MGTRVTLQGVKLSYPHLFQARIVKQGDDPKFGAAFLIPKNHPCVPQVQQAIQAEKNNSWGASVPPTVTATLYDGDTDPKYNTVPENRGHFILNTSSSAEQPPTLVDANLQKVINPATFYAGCFVNADIGFYSYDKGVSKGIAAGLNGVQFVQDGERLDNRPSAEEMFGPPVGAPAPIAPGIAGQPDQYGGNPAPQQLPPQGAPGAYQAGASTQAAPMAPAPAGAPIMGGPAFLG